MYSDPIICYNLLNKEIMADFFIYHSDFEKEDTVNSKKAEGDLYRVIELDGDRFEILYGYYDDRDRVGKYSEPIPIYPDFLSEPRYDSKGRPYVTEMQDICENYNGKPFVDICNGCTHYKRGDDLIGTCHCANRRRRE